MDTGENRMKLIEDLKACFTQLEEDVLGLQKRVKKWCKDQKVEAESSIFGRSKEVKKSSVQKVEEGGHSTQGEFF